MLENQNDFEKEVNSAIDDILSSKETPKVEPANAPIVETKGDVKAVDEKVVADAADVDEKIAKSVDDEPKQIVDEKVENKEDEQKVVAPKFSGTAITRAIKAGLSYDDVLAFPSESSLSSVVGRLESIAKSHIATVPEKKEEVVDPLAGLKKLDPEEYDEEVRDVIKTFNVLTDVVKAQQAKITAAEVVQKQPVAADEYAAAQEISKWFDDSIEKLGSDFKESLGEGKFESLDVNSGAFVKRKQLADHIAVLLAGYRASGRDAPSRDEVFSTAAKAVLADEYQKAHDAKLQTELAERSKQHISRVSGNKGKESISPLDEVAAILDGKFFSQK